MAGERIVVGGATLTQAFGCTGFACSCGCEWDCNRRCGCAFGFHAGVDLAARSNTPMTAAGYGTVFAVGRVLGACGGLGPFAVGIKSANVAIWYGHCARNLVSVGQAVHPGQQVALMGFLGCVYPHGAGGTHCHFEVLPWGKTSGCDALNPIPYLTSWPQAAPVTPPPPGPPPPGPSPIPTPAQASAWPILLGGAALVGYALTRER
jgi:murein DD-endopeptidase MepM/ murein hydrolase activator NlpD